MEITDDMEKAIGVHPQEVYLGRDLLMVLPTEQNMRNLKPEMKLLKKLPGLIRSVTAKGLGYDCVSRIFAPKLDMMEVPVTGSIHCMIAPYWAKQLNKTEINAYQASKRGGKFICEVLSDERINISGSCVLYSRAIIFL